MDLRLIVITDSALAAPRAVEDVLRAALTAGAPAVQLRDKTADARSLFVQARALLRLTRAHGALLFVNDRLDVALAAGADGVHLGPDDLPVTAARSAVPAEFLVGFSTDDPELARHAAADGAVYIGCGAVFGTRTKDVGEERIGPEGLRRVVEAVKVPVIGIGGVTPDNVGELVRVGAAGAAVVAAVMKSADVHDTVRKLLAPFHR